MSRYVDHPADRNPPHVADEAQAWLRAEDDRLYRQLAADLMAEPRRPADLRWVAAAWAMCTAIWAVVLWLIWTATR